MTDSEPGPPQTEADPGEAASDTARAASVRHALARRYVLRLRRRHPEATPAELIRLLERDYAASINAAGAVISAGAIVADVGIALIPVAGAAAAGVKSAGQQAAKKAGEGVVKASVRGTAKLAAKGVALGTAKTGAQRLAAMLPAGDRQLQFEITAIFGLAIADIHAMVLDKDQAHALVYGLTNGRVSQQQIATMAADLAKASADDAVAAGRDRTGDWSHWAGTLADALPAGAAQDLVRTVQTGQLNTVRDQLDGRQQARIEYGVGALVDGVAHFVFGREVVTAARTAFPPAPEEFPSHLTVPSAAEDDEEHEPNRALAALEHAARSTGGWIAGTAGTVGSGVASAAGTVGGRVADVVQRLPGRGKAASRRRAEHGSAGTGETEDSAPVDPPVE